MNPQERSRYLVIFLFTAPGAAIVWYVFRSVYDSMEASVRVVGYVDPVTQTGITLGYVTMIGGTLVLAITAVWSGIMFLRLSRRNR